MTAFPVVATAAPSVCKVQVWLTGRPEDIEMVGEEVAVMVGRLVEGLTVHGVKVSRVHAVPKFVDESGVA